MIDMNIFIIMLAIFIAATAFLGWYGYKHTKSNDQFLLGRNKTSPLIIALSYGATFLSASAVVGFGGQSAKYGMIMIWLVVLNLLVGLVVAFLIYGKRTRRIGREVGAFTFSDLLGKRYKSPSVRLLSASIILIGMPIYCAAVLLGGVNFLEATLGINKDLILIGFSVIVALYVTYGGVIAVMYNDALQAAIMFIGMIIILVFTYMTLGGGANLDLTNLWDSANPAVIGPLADQGMNGWTSAPDFLSQAWLTVITTFMLGVGIGALAQPQLVVRFMSAKDDKTLNKSLIIGSIFMIAIVGSAYTVGALSNVFFTNEQGMIAIEYVKNVDMIIPTFVNELFAGVAFGDIFIVIFVLALLCASISTMSALLHTMGTSAGYDIMSEVKKKQKKEYTDAKSLRVTRICTLLIMIAIVIIAYVMPFNIIAKATSIFMGLTAAALLPAYTHSLYSKNPNLFAAKCSIVVGLLSWAIWGFFINAGIAGILGIPMVINDSLLNFVDPLVISLPLSILALIIGLYMRPQKDESPMDQDELVYNTFGIVTPEYIEKHFPSAPKRKSETKKSPEATKEEN